MEEVKTKPIEENNEVKKELKIFRGSFITFFVGEVFLIVSTLSRATIINGVPRIFAIFSMFTTVAYILYTVAAFVSRNLNVNAKKALLSVAIFDVVAFIYQICLTSTDAYYNNLARGLYWSENILLCVFYVFYFFGVRDFFRKYSFDKASKRSFLSIIIFVVFFLGEVVFEYLSTTKLVLSNAFANRFFLYGTWAFEFLLYVSIFAVSIVAMAYINKHIPHGKEDKKKHEKVSK